MSQSTDIQIDLDHEAFQPTTQITFGGDTFHPGTQIALNRDAFQQHYDVIWGAHEWEADAVLPISYEKRPGTDGPLSTVHVPIHNADVIWNKILELGSDRKIWVGIAPRSKNAILARIEENKAWNAANRHEILAFNAENKAAIDEGTVQRRKFQVTELEWIRGTKTECYAMPGFALDLDVDMASSEHDEHKMDKPAEDGKAPKILPSTALAEQWIEECPIPYVLKIWTGGGFHVWYAAAHLMTAEEQEQALARFKSYWVGVKESSGVHIDVGVIEVTRVMRPAGSLKGKGAPEVFFSPIETREFNPENRFTAADIDKLPEYVDPRRARTVRKSDGTIQHVSPRSQAEKDDLPGTKLSHDLPVSFLLEEVLGFYRSGDKLTRRVDGDYNVSLYTSEDGAELVRVYGEHTADMLNLDSSRSYSSFGLLINYWCGGVASLAARIAAHYETDTEGLVELLKASPTAEELAKSFPAKANIDALLDDHEEKNADTMPGSIPVDDELKDAVDSIAADLGAPVTIQEHIAAGVRYTWNVEGDDNFFVVIHKGQTGLWERHKAEEGKEPWLQRHTHWVAWRSEARSELVLSPEGKPVQAVDNTFTVQLIHSSGRTYEAQGLSGKDSSDAKIVIQKMNAGVTLPVTIAPRRHLDNVLTGMGRYDGQVDRPEFTSTGILERDGKHFYILPAGSVGAEGVTKEFTVGPPAGSDKNALRPAMVGTGFDRVLEGDELRKAAESVRAYLAISPNRKDYGLATLAAPAAAVLPQSRRTSILALAKPGIGKSVALSCLQAFVSSVGVDGKSFSMTFSNGTTGAGATLIAAWHNASCGFYDDYRLDEDVIENKLRTKVMNSIVQNSYGADGRAAGNGPGLRGSSTSNTMSVITGEGAPPAGTAIHSRYVRLSMEKGDFALNPRGSSPLDAFVDGYARTGLARAFFATFVQWVMAKIDAKGSIEAFKDEVDARKKGFESATNNRAVETASTVVVAWMYLIDWATENGFEDLFPTIDEVTETMIAVASDNAEKVAQLSPGKAIVEKIAELIGGGSAYVESHDLTVPRGNERILGWEAGFQGEWTYKNRVLMGYLSEDRTQIFVPAIALNHAAKLTGITIKGDQLEGYLAPLVTPGTVPNSKSKANLGIAKRTRGYAFPVETLELDLTPPATLPAAPNQATSAQTKPAPKTSSLSVSDGDF